MSLNAETLAERIWARETALWAGEGNQDSGISERLGWLDVPEQMRTRAGDLVWLARDARRDGFRHAVLLGMGGSSLAAEVFNRIFPVSPRGLDLKVLDTTDPGAIQAAEKEIDLARTLFIVSSKSGSTIEVDSLFRYFYSRTGGRGSQFAAITDPDTDLARLAGQERFRALFINPPDIGGRYSALSLFGLVPAALLGLDTGRILDSALRLRARCAAGVDPAENDGLKLGLALGEAALAGRDKVTLLMDERIAPLGLWIEQLLAESTGKNGTGLVPISLETAGWAESYGADRIFVVVSLGHSLGFQAEKRLDELEEEGHPVFRISMKDYVDIGGEFFRWEFATAVAGAVLGVNPFDQPNVQEAKDRTRALLAQTGRAEAFPEPDMGSEGERLGALFDSIRHGRDYLNLLAYIPFDADLDERLPGLCSRLRDAAGAAVSFGYGPRYLHSTGQLHKGGPDSGAFIFFTCAPERDLEIPGAGISFGRLEQAQALGDISSLVSRGRRVAHVRLESPASFIPALERLIESA